MRKSSRRGKSLSHSYKKDEVLAKNDSWNTIDRWLYRLSHFAQFALLVITLLSLYYTVLPLYQKALLEESIAKKELDLKNIKELLDSAYHRVRYSAIREFHSLGTKDCTTLWRVSEVPDPFENAEPSSVRYESSFYINVRECLENIVKRPQIIDGLSNEDKQYLLVMVDNISDRIENARDVFLMNYQNAHNTITQEEANSMELKGMRAQVLKHRAELFKDDDISKEWLQLAIEIQQEIAAYDYQKFIRKEIISIGFPL